jgi:hypothetical protein
MIACAQGDISDVNAWKRTLGKSQWRPAKPFCAKSDVEL